LVPATLFICGLSRGEYTASPSTPGTTTAHSTGPRGTLAKLANHHSLWWQRRART
jgi:hypothetical protein